MEAEQWKRSKYSHLEATHCFIPVAVETLRVGAMGPEARSLFKETVSKAHNNYGEKRAHEYIQWVAVAVQRGNTASVLRTLQRHCTSPPTACTVRAGSDSESVETI